MATYVMMAKSKSHHYPYHQHLPLISRIAVHYKYLLLISCMCTRKKRVNRVKPQSYYTWTPLHPRQPLHPFHPIMMCYSYNKCWTFQFVEQSRISKVFFIIITVGCRTWNVESTFIVYVMVNYIKCCLEVR